MNERAEINLQLHFVSQVEVRAFFCSWFRLRNKNGFNLFAMFVLLSVYGVDNEFHHTIKGKISRAQRYIN